MATEILNAARTSRLIGTIRTMSAKLDQFTHQAALSALANHVEHGNTTLANELILALGKSQRKHALVAWMLANDTALALNPDKAGQKTQPLIHVRLEDGVSNVFDVTKADENPFWTFKAKEGEEVFAYDTWLASVTKALNKGIAGAADDATKAKIQAALAALS